MLARQRAAKKSTAARSQQMLTITGVTRRTPVVAGSVTGTSRQYTDNLPRNRRPSHRRSNIAH